MQYVYFYRRFSIGLGSPRSTPLHWLQSDAGRALLQVHGREANDISSIVFVAPKGAYMKSDAILGITQELNHLPFVPLRPLAMLGQWAVPQILRDAIYHGVADNQYSIMGKQDEWRIDDNGELRTGALMIALQNSKPHYIEKLGVYTSPSKERQTIYLKDFLINPQLTSTS